MKYLNNKGKFQSMEQVWEINPYGGKEGDFLYIGEDRYFWDKFGEIWVKSDPADNIPAGSDTQPVEPVEPAKTPSAPVPLRESETAILLNDLGTYDDIGQVWDRYPYGGREGDYVVVDGKKYGWNKYELMWGDPTDQPVKLTTDVTNSKAGEETPFVPPLEEVIPTNRGEFDSIEDVWKAFPNGGKEGDYVVVKGEELHWDKYSQVWGSSKLNVTTEAFPVSHLDGKLEVENDVSVGNNADIEGWLRVRRNINALGSVKIDGVLDAPVIDGNVAIRGNLQVDNKVSVSGDLSANNITAKGDLEVRGVLKANKVSQPNKGLFSSVEKLREEWPNPNVGDWAMIGDTTPGIIWTCNETGIWESTGKIGGIDSVVMDDYLHKYNNSRATAVIDFANGFEIASLPITSVLLEHSTGQINDQTIMTARRVLREIKKKEELNDDRYLRKDKEDQTRFLLKFLAGIEIGNFFGGGGAKIDENGTVITNQLVSNLFTSGMLGSGFTLKKSEDGRSYLETDDLLVRRKAVFAVLEILKSKYIGGDIIQGPGGGTCRNVEEFETFYRCYLLADDGKKAVENTFDIDDFVRCQEFNVAAGVHENVSNQYYWRRCIAIADDGSYIDLSKEDCDKGSLPPQAGDEMATLGNASNPDRQNATVYGVYGNDAPYIKQYVGINSYDLTGKEKTVISPNGNKFTGKFYFSSGGEVESLFNDLKKRTEENSSFVEQLSKDFEEVKKQIDGNITTWFYDPEPTLQNLPCVEWKDDKERDSHLKDLYFDKKGLVYRFEKKNGSYEWVLIEDEQLAKALADAKKAQDTADHKRRVFVERPTPPYDKGDLWTDGVDLRRCIHSRESGAYDSSDWGLATNYTDDTVAQEAKDRLSSWAEDGVISPPEKQGIREEKVRIEKDWEYINSVFTNFELGIPKAYNSAYEIYDEQLRILSAETPEIIGIPSDFSDNMSKYYSERKLALDVVDNHIQGTFVATNEKIEGTIHSINTLEGTVDEHTTKFLQTDKKIETQASEIKTMGDTISEHTTLIQQTSDEIKLKASQSELDSITGIVNDHETAIEQNAEAIKLKASTSALDKLAGTVSNNSTAIEQNSTDIKLKASQSTVDLLTGQVTENSSKIEQNAFNISLKVGQKELEDALTRKAGVNLLPAEEISWAVSDYLIDAAQGSLWGEMKVESKNRIVTKGLIYVGAGSIKLYAKVHGLKSDGSPNYYFSIAQFDSEGKYLGRNNCKVDSGSSDYTTSWHSSLCFTTASDCRYLAVCVKQSDESATYPFHAYYAKIKIEVGDEPTIFTPCTNPDTSAGLLETGIDIQNKKIVLTANRTWIRSNDGQDIAVFGTDDDGGIILKSEVSVTKLKAEVGTIGYFTIDDGGLIYDRESWDTSHPGTAVLTGPGAHIYMSDGTCKFNVNVSAWSGPTLLVENPRSTGGFNDYSLKAVGLSRFEVDDKNSTAMEVFGGIDIEGRLDALGLNVHGQCTIKADDGFNVNIYGLALNMRTINSSYQKIKTNEDFILFTNTSDITVTLPSNPSLGKVLFIKQTTGSQVTFNGGNIIQPTGVPGSYQNSFSKYAHTFLLIYKGGQEWCMLQGW